MQWQNGCSRQRSLLMQWQNGRPQQRHPGLSLIFVHIIQNQRWPWQWEWQWQWQWQAAASSQANVGDDNGNNNNDGLTGGVGTHVSFLNYSRMFFLRHRASPSAPHTQQQPRGGAFVFCSASSTWDRDVDQTSWKVWKIPQCQGAPKAAERHLGIFQTFQEV